MVRGKTGFRPSYRPPGEAVHRPGFPAGPGMGKTTGRAGPADFGPNGPVCLGRERTFPEERMSDFATVGKPNPRFDAVPKADGSLPYGEDQVPANALHCGLLYSPVPCGRIKRLDAPDALRVPGVAAVLTAKDVPGKNEHYGSGHPPPAPPPLFA